MSFDVSSYCSAPSDTNKQKYTNAYNMIKNFIESDATKLTKIKDKSISVYLQGSYANSTNIREDSDVDIVVECDSIFLSDTSVLSETNKKYLLGKFVDAELSIRDFRLIMYNALNDKFDNVSIGNKSVKIIGNSYRVNVDVIPCIQYRKYTSLNEYIAGIALVDQYNNRIYSYPKLHLEKCVTKNKNTDGNYKSLVRAYKRFISMINIQNDLTSYRIENLLYNISDTSLIGDINAVFLKSLDILSNTDYSDKIFKCADGINSITLTVNDQQIIKGLKEAVK